MGFFLVVCSLGSFFDLSILKRDVVEKTRRAILMGLGGRESLQIHNWKVE